MPVFRTFSLQSGSCGNCIYVEADNTRLLIDAGVSGVHVKKRLFCAGIDPTRIDAVLISHNHGDHSRCAGVYHRMFSADLWISRKTASVCRLGKLRDVHHFTPGHPFRLNGITVHPFPTPHDGIDGVAFVFEHREKRLGILTDLGHAFPGLSETITTLDGVYLESNHDPQMLRTGSYPAPLKQRVAGNRGHLSNEECASLLLPAFGKHLQWAVLSHLSTQNNTPAIALNTARQILGSAPRIEVAPRDRSTDLLTL